MNADELAHEVISILQVACGITSSQLLACMHVVVRVCHIYKDVWSAEMDSELPYHALHSQQSCRPIHH